MSIFRSQIQNSPSGAAVIHKTRIARLFSKLHPAAESPYARMCEGERTRLMDEIAREALKWEWVRQAQIRISQTEVPGKARLADGLRVDGWRTDFEYRMNIQGILERHTHLPVMARITAAADTLVLPTLAGALVGVATRNVLVGGICCVTFGAFSISSYRARIGVKKAEYYMKLYGELEQAGIIPASEK